MCVWVIFSERWVYEMEDVTFVYFDSRVGGMLGNGDAVLVEWIVIFGWLFTGRRRRSMDETRERGIRERRRRRR